MNPEFDIPEDAVILTPENIFTQPPAMQELFASNFYMPRLGEEEKDFFARIHQRIKDSDPTYVIPEYVPPEKREVNELGHILPAYGMDSLQERLQPEISETCKKRRGRE